MAVLEFEKVVEVSSYLARWAVEGSYIPAGDLGHMLGQEGLLDQARHPKLLLDALTLLSLSLLLAHQLGYLHSRCCLGRQVV
jgi:hypothetical protein